ncbi:MAG: MBL fold metallo-hydrolase [Spirochaetaceae bacterium]|jgi:phosphoribosyl 1,2-cyclic phosphodiesterase|nr:MBL fold metallo-hydrolase [Spirochaetaceae bacterium]
MMFSITIWGTRGSIACPGQYTNEFGGNTTCLEVRADGNVCCVDFGTGVRPFGEYLEEHDLPAGLTHINFFITHTHWDHIIGFPMFKPVFIKGMKIDIYSTYMPNGKSLKGLLRNELSYEYWPVNLRELNADIRFHQVREETLRFPGGLRVITHYLNHPAPDLGYRFEYGGKSIVVIHDSEPFFNQFLPFSKGGRASFFDIDASREAAKAAEEGNAKIISFMKAADIVVYDAQYTEEEYKTEKLNWGHSSYQCAAQNSIAAGVKHLLLNHHDPSRSDSELLAYEKKLKKEYGSQINIDMAREGASFNL